MARRFKEFGHEVRIIAPQFVKPFVKGNKDEASGSRRRRRSDSGGLRVPAASRAKMRFVAPKEEWPQDLQSMHRVRQRLVRNQTALSHEIRALLFEYGVVIPQGLSPLFETLDEVLSSESRRFSFRMKETLQELRSELHEIQEKIKVSEARLKADASERQECQRLQKIKGIGSLTATTILAAVGDPKSFKNGRPFSAWLGLVPRPTGSGGKNTILGLSKRGDR